MIEVEQEARRRDFGHFLRQRRSLLQPAEVGLPAGGRRHVRGLRRSEVAEIAQIGVTWYSMLEQGRVENVSSRTLDAIAKALRFGSAEREHLGELAAGAFVSQDADLPPPPALLEFVRRVEFGMAFIVSPAFNVVAHNERANEMFEFADHGTAPNLLRIMLADKRMRSRFVAPSYDDVLKQMIGHFRSSYGRYGGAAFARLINELQRYEPFARVWSDCALMPPPSERSRIVLRDGSVRDVCVMAFTSFSAPAYTLIFKVPAQSPRESSNDLANTERSGQPTRATQMHSKRCAEFGAFLRRRREAIKPQDIGLIASGRRHARGLRRDEVANRAGIGVSRYTMLEQGRIGTLPPRTLQAIADALLFGPRERTYLARLAASASALEAGGDDPLPNADLANFVRTYPLGLAHFHDADFNLIAWNSEAGRFYGYDGYARPNLLEVMADNPALRRGFIEPTWEATLRHMLAHYRFTHASPIAEGREELLASLIARTPDFGRVYAQERNVVNPAIAAARFDLPVHGPRDTNVFLLTPAACPSHIVVLKNFIGASRI
jgi:transcriptional regulator with XRE-family HTH domain